LIQSNYEVRIRLPSLRLLAVTEDIYNDIGDLIPGHKHLHKKIFH